MKNYNQFLFERIVTDQNLLDSIEAKERVSGKVFGINSDNFQNLEDLFNDKNFNKKLLDENFRKDNFETTKEYETFLKNTLNFKYFLIFREKQNELEKPRYIFIQIKSGDKWKPIELYKVNSDMKNFYDLLTNKKIEIKLNGKSYIYTTTNGGYDWTLQNKENMDQMFKQIMRTEDIDQILKNDKNGTIEEKD